MELFWERGYEAVSLAELTEELGINKPSLYAAFGCKEALFREAIELYSSTEGSSTLNALRDQPTARAAVEAMLRNNARNYTTPGRPRGCMVVLAASVGSSENEEVRAFLSSIRRQAREMLVERVERGVREGDVSAKVDPQRVATFYNTVLTGLSVQARDGASVQTMNHVIDDAMALWETVAS
jgi:AcrR family transcriptional regulator